MIDSTELIVKLAKTRDLTDAKKAVKKLVQDHGFRWRPLGDRENNYGQVNIGSDPGTAFIERVTNAIDAVVEHEAFKRGAHRSGESVNVQKPREATERWLSIPSGRIRNLDLKRRQKLADRVRVIIRQGGGRTTPTVEVRDYGIGLRPLQFPNTIMALGASNKIDKPYLAGAYGQGGSTALAFSPEGTLFVSRRQPDLQEGGVDQVAITFAQFKDLDPAVNKNGRYEYLVTPDESVPVVNVADLPAFEPGTSVTHFKLEIPDYSRKLTQLTGSFWWLLQNSLFDPVLPFWAEDQRPDMMDGDKPIRRSIVGNHTRLWTDENNRIEHADSIIIPFDDGEAGGSGRVYYWVVKERESASGGRPIDAYVDPYKPVAYTYFGQTHGTEDRRFISERLHFPYLTKYLILHIELDNIAPATRRQLLSATRDRLKKSAVYDEMRERIAVALAEDSSLIRINEQRKEEILSRHSESERKEMQKKLARLMESLEVGPGPRVAGKSGNKAGRRESLASESEGMQPLPTREEPTFLRIANVQRPIPVRKRRRALLRLESDAPDSFLTKNASVRLELAQDPEGTLFVDSVSDFKGGRSRMLIKPSDEVAIGTNGRIHVKLLTGNGNEFSSTAPFEIAEPKDKRTTDGTGRAEVQTPEPIAIAENQWDEFGWDESSVAEVHSDRETPRIYVNIDNQHIRRLLREGGYQERGMKRMKNNYLLYVAYFAWLQHYGLEREEVDLSGMEFERYLHSELDRAARTVVHSISAIGRL